MENFPPRSPYYFFITESLNLGAIHKYSPNKNDTEVIFKDENECEDNKNVHYINGQNCICLLSIQILLGKILEK